MNREINLKRAVPVRCWRVVGQIAKAKKRPELIPVLLRAREKGGTDARDLAEHLLFESRSRKVVGERLLHIACAYGLVETEGRDRVFNLTEAGETAIETDEVLVPEYGAWTIWASEDPLLRYPILRIDPWKEPNASEELYGKERRNARKRSADALPSWLREAAGKAARPGAQQNSGEIRIEDLESQAEAVYNGETLRLRWNVTDHRLQLTGNLGGDEVATELEVPPEAPEPGDIWLTLLEGRRLQERWDEDEQRLRVTFDETGDAEREAISRDLEFESPVIPGYGEFETLTVRGVPITPAIEADAQSWAKWRLQTRIQDYATSERYATWCAAAADPFDEYEVDLPSRTELFNEFSNRTANRPEPRFWHLAAAEDWRL